MHSLALNEHADTVSGNLLITATDLAFPGPIPLAVARIYNSQIHSDFEQGHSLAVGDDSWTGIDWSLHWGHILRTELTGELPGGGGGAAVHDVGVQRRLMTKGFARYNRTTKELKLPNGLIYTCNQSTTT